MKDFFKDPNYETVAILSIISVTTLFMIFAETASFVSNNYHTVYATAKNATQTTSSSTAKTKDSALPVDVPTIIAAPTAAAALAGVFWGVYQYTKGQITTRQSVLFQAIKEFNDSDEMILAKEILGYNYVRDPKGNWHKNKKDEKEEKPYPTYYSITNLSTILRKWEDTGDPVTDPGEIEIRNSFDNLIVFLGKIGYLLMVGAITLDESLYFAYYIHTIQANKDVKNYIKKYDFPLYRILLEELKKERIFRPFTKFHKYEKKFPIENFFLSDNINI